MGHRFLLCAIKHQPSISEDPHPTWIKLTLDCVVLCVCACACVCVCVCVCLRRDVCVRGVQAGCACGHACGVWCACGCGCGGGWVAQRHSWAKDNAVWGGAGGGRGEGAGFII